MTNSVYDAIVIGAGHNGLVTARVPGESRSRHAVVVARDEPPIRLSIPVVLFPSDPPIPVVVDPEQREVSAKANPLNTNDLYDFPPRIV